MEVDTLQELAVHSLKDLYSAETQILQALPKMVEAASHPELKSAFSQHLEETRTQVQRLEQIFEHLGQSPGGVTCKGMQGLITEGQEVVEAGGDPDVRDAGLIAAAQKVEHYEIAGYGTACVFARLLGHNDALQLLKQTINEEEQTDKKLTQIAEQVVNPAAAQA
jgi:ferritin-like metal-binding protein YciE